MNTPTTRGMATNPDPGSVGGHAANSDRQFEALLAAGVLAWAGSALAGASPPESEPMTQTPAVEKAECGAEGSEGRAADDVERWARHHAAGGQRLIASGRERLMRWWDDARLAAWGEATEPREPRLQIFDAAVEHNPFGGSEKAIWRDFGARDEAPGRGVVVLVHGLDEAGFVWDDLAPALAQAGLTPVRFEYPNDQAIRTTTDQLAAALRTLHAAGMTRIDLVGHSMGGLVGRDLLTREDLYAGDARGGVGTAHDLPAVTRLIMLATPHHGSPIAGLMPLSEAREHLVRRVEGTNEPGEGWLHSTRDGRGDAAEDLAAGSEFLRELNARPLPTGVTITNIVSRMVSNGERQRLRSALARGLADLLDADTTRAVTGYVDDALDGLGDGLVSVDAMMLDGVEDTVEVKANHRSLIRRMRLGTDSEPTGTMPPAVPIILNRLHEAE